MGIPHSDRGISAHIPEAKRKREGVALCLSGGGFRAALFHLGALRRLNELGVLSRVDTLSSVSGGSILAAHLAETVNGWPAAGDSVPGWEERVATPFRAFAETNIRTWPILKRVLLPWNWFRTSTGVRALAVTYRRRLTGLSLADLPRRPRFILCSTDMAFGVNWVFDSGGSRFQSRLGDYQAGYISPIPNWPLALAVAASSCFPPVFNPLPVELQPDRLKGGKYSQPDRNQLVEGIRLSDGGVYDNLGLEPVWKDHRVVLVSDGGAVFEVEADTGLLWRMKRYAAITARGGGSVRKRWLLSNLNEGVMEGAYWGIGGAAQHYPSSPPGYSERLVDEVIAEVRTDLDAFSHAEIAVLENHGYLLADAAIQKHAPTLARPDAPVSEIPHPDWMDEAVVRGALVQSNKRKILGRS